MAFTPAFSPRPTAPTLAPWRTIFTRSSPKPGMAAAVVLCALAALPGCASDATRLPRAGLVQPPAIVLLGEQHDAPSHPARHAQAVAQLAGTGQLGALALEMADLGTSTADLPESASEADAQAALRWRAQAWPWDNYRAAVMAAVRAKVPVLGANLPRAELPNAMKNIALDRLLTWTSWQKQQKLMAEGHCNLLPEAQIIPMARIQVARDLAMAQTLTEAAAKTPGKTVLLIAGAAHTDSALGVPAHLLRLAPALRVQTQLWPSVDTGVDYCAQVKRP